MTLPSDSSEVFWGSRRAPARYLNVVGWDLRRYYRIKGWEWKGHGVESRSPCLVPYMSWQGWLV